MSSSSSAGAGVRSLLVEAIRVAASQRVGSLVVLATVAAVFVSVLTTAGRAAELERNVLGAIGTAETRLITLTDERGGADIDAGAIERLARLDSVEWAIGLGLAEDARNSSLGPGADPVPARAVYGDITRIAELSGRPPRTGEAIVGREAQSVLGLDVPAGAVGTSSGASLAVVGAFRPTSSVVRSLDRSVLFVPEPADPVRIRSIHVMVRRSESVASSAQAAVALLGATDPGEVTVTTSEALAEIREAVSGQLTASSRGLGLGTLLVGLGIISAVATAVVTMRRVDFGRRRALGARRADVVVLVVFQYLALGLAGSAVGSAIGLIGFATVTGDRVSADFVVATAVLTTLVTAAAAVPPAILAAFRDPVRVLRVP